MQILRKTAAFILALLSVNASDKMKETAEEKM